MQGVVLEMIWSLLLSMGALRTPCVYLCIEKDADIIIIAVPPPHPSNSIYMHKVRMIFADAILTQHAVIEQNVNSET